MKKEWTYYVLPFLFIFIITILIVNWTQISWFFDWRVVKEVVRESGEKKPSQLWQEAIGEEDKLVIPSLGIESPLRFPTTSDIQTITTELDLGVVYYPGSAEPGEIGKTVILGHSAPAGYPDIKFDKIFSDLGNLQSGDNIILYYNEKIFEYEVSDVRTMSIQEYDEYLLEASSEHLLILSTCYPPGKNWQRWVVISQLLTK